MDKKTEDALVKAGFYKLGDKEWINLNLAEALSESEEGLSLRMTTGRQYAITDSDRGVIEDRVGKTTS